MDIITKFCKGEGGEPILASKAFRRVKAQSSFVMIKGLGEVRGWSIE